MKALIKEKNLIIESDDNKRVRIKFDNNITVTLNGKKIVSNSFVRAEDYIQVIGNDVQAKRNLNIKFANKKLKCMASIEYVPEKLVKISSTVVNDEIILTSKIEDGKQPPPYTTSEIVILLRKAGVRIGLDRDKIDELIAKGNGAEEVVAEGISPINDEEDTVKIYFKAKRRNVDVDSLEKIDYKNLYSHTNVSKGDVIAELIIGQEGEDGTDVLGDPIKRNRKKAKTFRADLGCELEDNKIISKIDGRPTVKNGVFVVNKLFQVQSDVDIKSGNIDFIGDIVVDGSVKEGMQVTGGNSISINGNVEQAKVAGRGAIEISGNVIGSEVKAKYVDKKVKSNMELLVDLKSHISTLIESAKIIRNKAENKGHSTDKEIVDILLNSKFNSVTREALVVSSLLKENVELADDLRKKIVLHKTEGINHLTELYDLIKSIEKEIETMRETIVLPVDVVFKYSQDSIISATGDIVIEGKGQYASRILAEGNIEFTKKNSVSRGGLLYSRKSIKAREVGSQAGISTILKVSPSGVITADIVYQNTEMYFGEKVYIVDKPVKDFKGYLNEAGEIIVEKFLL